MTSLDTGFVLSLRQKYQVDETLRYASSAYTPLESTSL